MISETPSNKQSAQIKTTAPVPKWLVLLFLVFSFAGFVDSSYLAAKHFLGGPVPCTLFEGCEKVLSSSYSVIFGVPVALAGALYYLTFFGLTIAYLDLKRKKIIRAVSYFSFAGLAASAWFVFVQLVLIKAICEFCMLSALTSTVLFITGITFLLKSREP